ncbi:glycoside hydrolase family 95 protein [Aureobasidium subglaciale EXF-2481]|uniref:Glycoside hydrolase family 95 protein n=1 Tax=Aureobasidium subglaciale (strain EXF-2481) TaxID=1043005 RepID=A0A074Z3V1_AURSE|nr:glycoside hydrolase family 95 protein [Aureobasidium subglaciale EXF-2481]KAI5212835.1 glycoside hydrolase family 95 protein [Aureobasidium subglaciale]KAI5232473.1 glycoside hydrolase family 95 protein [Aureobasidium subglaciale]KAI5234779.1 glycoside hydrolase family 95 protein [Aureobasidium subglaciale]KAI5268349.1 glycoside hydrolase family 95 protein [Aureobasidium subglaciale]KEQ93681.1 glycoside hydrolase family 95 protein [Aureobasidium subglaciale EXF-2481]
MVSFTASGLVCGLCIVQGTYAKALWATEPANNFTDIIRTAYPVGNGRLAALPFGNPGQEKFSFNIDSLWSGGPFENSSYNGGNPESPVSSALPGIRDWIFQNGTGNVTALMGDNNNYGSYAVLGNLTISIDGITQFTSYNRSLDLTNGVHTTSFVSSGSIYTSKFYCSYPDSVCVYELASTNSLPKIDISFENQQSNASLVNSSCSTSTRIATLEGITQTDIGMLYRAEAMLIGRVASLSCSSGVLTIHPNPKHRSIVLVVGAGTNYAEDKGNAAANYSFRGSDPGDHIATVTALAASKGAKMLLRNHVADYTALSSRFVLNLPDTAGSTGKPTADIIAAYKGTENITSDPYYESLQFDYGRHLFISSSRQNSLPPNLQGKWAYGLQNAWGADYHANINLQMNHWGVDQTGLGELQEALWRYMTETWVPRGSETAKLLYDAPGWVTHDEMNVFGHTGMKTGDEYWANYPASAAWMMLHVADHFAYSQDFDWLREIGYPLLEGVASFWLSQLQEDRNFNDGTLVVNPCSSPEHGPTTFGCTHYQQLLHSLFTNTLSSAQLLNISSPMIPKLTHALKHLDTGLHINPNLHTLQEWKLTPLDTLYNKNSTHRHLSHLIGWYPGTSLSALSHGYTNTTIHSAIRNTLGIRGPGIADANAGWEKLWRAACYARLNDSVTAYHELKLTTSQNIADNGLSMYSGKNEPFQIDANFGFVGAVLGMLVVDLDAEGVVVLGPAVPREWGGGSVEGLRVKGGGSVDFRWDEVGIVEWAECLGTKRRVINLEGKVLC